MPIAFPRHDRAAATALTACIACSAPLAVASAEGDTGRLGLDLVDPITAQDHVAFRFDWDTQIGGFDEGKRQTLGIEPVFSFDLDHGARIVSETDVPLVRLEGVVDDDTQTGLGDVVQTLYYVPASVANERGFHWGVGLTLRLPVASDDALGRDAWALGPAFAATWIGERWTWGAQLQHQQAFGGDDDDDGDDEDEDDFTLFRPFLARDFGSGWSAGVLADGAYDWERDRLKGPVTLYARKALVSGGGDAYAFDAGFRYWIDGPTEEPEWGVRLGFAWAF